MFFQFVESAVSDGILRNIIRPTIRVAARSIIPCIVFQNATSPMYAPNPIRPSEFPKKLIVPVLENIPIITSGVML